MSITHNNPKKLLVTTISTIHLPLVSILLFPCPFLVITFSLNHNALLLSIALKLVSKSIDFSRADITNILLLDIIAILTSLPPGITPSCPAFFCAHKILPFLSSPFLSFPPFLNSPCANIRQTNLSRLLTWHDQRGERAGFAREQE